MTQHPPVLLRYFDARGRGQFLRGYFLARGIEFEDERVPLDEGFVSWTSMRDDRALTGPLKRLPVLQYGDQLIPETAVIAAFVHRTFGDAALLDKSENLQQEVLISTCNVDLLLQLGILLWSDLMFEGIDLNTYAGNSLDRIGRTLDVLDETLADWGWVSVMDERPVTVADCFLWEELDQAKTVFGSRLVLDDRSQLARFHAECPARETFEQALESQPAQITARPDEEAAIARIRTCLSK